MANAAPASIPPAQTYVPTNKTIGSTVGSAVGVIVVWLINEYVRPLDSPLPVEIQGAITVLVTFALGYLVPPGKREAVLVTANGAARSATK
jgi:hypothetical protein